MQTTTTKLLNDNQLRWAEPPVAAVAQQQHFFAAAAAAAAQWKCFINSAIKLMTGAGWAGQAAQCGIGGSGGSAGSGHIATTHEEDAWEAPQPVSGEPHSALPSLCHYSWLVHQAAFGTFAYD